MLTSSVSVIILYNVHSVAREVVVGCKICLSDAIRKGSSFGERKMKTY